ncbi:hypothetical protein HOLleu_00687 [Holothuria leucospilota]|uniref:Uncharacterized protein n=1 Tax=Holothuria leucospilota TaxID=206669 RepID=A0A9Q1CNZ7_HOLLE|nr:hypothetical protein HOLleu_00687 [Holothuria leucospilota]
MCVHVIGARVVVIVLFNALLKISDYHESTINTTKCNFYVDDCLKAVSSEERAIELYSEVTELLRGGFKLTKWVTNSVEVLSHSSGRQLLLPRILSSIKRALGGDIFGYKINVKEKPLTRRGLLSSVISIYDPLGLSVRNKG